MKELVEVLGGILFAAGVIGGLLYLIIGPKNFRDKL
jgi:hypothetical protein